MPCQIGNMLVHFVTDTPNKIPAIRAMLGPRHSVEPHLLGIAGGRAPANGVLVVDADLRRTELVAQIRAILRDVQSIAEKLFVVQGHLREMVAQAFALGATAVVSRPSEIAARLASVEFAQRRPEAEPDGAPHEIASSATSFSSMFAAIGKGGQITLSDAEKATQDVIDGIKRNGVRRYHEGTFQHCLLVTGIAVSFGMSIKFPDADVMRLGLAATLHDVGKARIPLAILDKPGRLDQTEQEIMNRHPVIGYELLKEIAEIGPEILDGVRHHHEYLDGSGYPDRLAAGEISDLVRLLTISDIFAALIERRPYRPSMSRPDAYKILCDMDGKLEKALVKAFRTVALKG